MAPRSWQRSCMSKARGCRTARRSSRALVLLDHASPAQSTQARHRPTQPDHTVCAHPPVIITGERTRPAALCSTSRTAAVCAALSGTSTACVQGRAAAAVLGGPGVSPPCLHSTWPAVPARQPWSRRAAATLAEAGQAGAPARGTRPAGAHRRQAAAHTCQTSCRPPPACVVLYVRNKTYPLQREGRAWPC